MYKLLFLNIKINLNCLDNDFYHIYQQTKYRNEFDRYQITHTHSLSSIKPNTKELENEEETISHLQYTFNINMFFLLSIKLRFCFYSLLINHIPFFISYSLKSTLMVFGAIRE